MLYNPAPTGISGVIGLGAIPDLTADTCGDAGIRIISDAQSDNQVLQTRLAAASPIELVPINISTILISGRLDGIVPPDISQAYVDAAIAAGDFSEHHIIEGANHFTLIDPIEMDIDFLQDSIERSLSF